MEDSAEAIAALDRPGRQWDHLGWLIGSELLDPLMRSGMVVVVMQPLDPCLQIEGDPVNDRVARSRAHGQNSDALGG